MKHTKSMKIVTNLNIEQQELYLFAFGGNGDLQAEKRYTEIEKNLRRKIKKDVFNVNKSVDLWYTLVNYCNKLYIDWYGYEFTVADRYAAAAYGAAEWYADETHCNLDFILKLMISREQGVRHNG